VRGDAPTDARCCRAGDPSGEFASLPNNRFQPTGFAGG